MKYRLRLYPQHGVSDKGSRTTSIEFCEIPTRRVVAYGDTSHFCDNRSLTCRRSAFFFFFFFNNLKTRLVLHVIQTKWYLWRQWALIISRRFRFHGMWHDNWRARINIATREWKENFTNPFEMLAIDIILLINDNDPFVLNIPTQVQKYSRPKTVTYFSDRLSCVIGIYFSINIFFFMTAIFVRL